MATKKIAKNIKFEELKCEKCDECKEIWICLSCGNSYCSRYINNHYKEHLNKNPTHSICISMMDLSVWCYLCEVPNEEEPGNYITSDKTDKYKKILHDFKYG